jgi:hypothetical protein
MMDSLPAFSLMAHRMKNSSQMIATYTSIGGMVSSSDRTRSQAERAPGERAGIPVLKMNKG